MKGKLESHLQDVELAGYLLIQLLKAHAYISEAWLTGSLLD